MQSVVGYLCTKSIGRPILLFELAHP